MRSPFYESPPSRITHDNVFARLSFQMRVNAILKSEGMRHSGESMLTDDETDEMWTAQDQGVSADDFARELTARDTAKAERMMRTST